MRPAPVNTPKFQVPFFYWDRLPLVVITNETRVYWLYFASVSVHIFAFTVLEVVVPMAFVIVSVRVQEHAHAFLSALHKVPFEMH
jgi:hypothetical protein